MDINLLNSFFILLAFYPQPLIVTRHKKGQPSRIASVIAPYLLNSLILVDFNSPLFNDDTHNYDLYYGGRGDNYTHNGDYK